MYPYPFVRDHSAAPIDGLVLKTPGYCKRANRSRCKAFYDSVRGAPGLYQCPFGYSAYVPKQLGHSIVSGFRVIGYFDRKQLQSRGGDGDFCPAIPEEHFLSTAEKMEVALVAYESVLAMDGRFRELKRTLDERIEEAAKFSHEVRNLNRDIKSAAEEMNAHLNREERVDCGYLSEKSETVFALSSLISVRLTSLDLAASPNTIIGRDLHPQVIHRKFFKARKCLINWAQRNNRKSIVLNGNTELEWPMLPVFDLIPFILLENAIKYAPPESMIYVTFEEDCSFLNVTVSSQGPEVRPDELGRLGSPRFRSDAAQAADSTGTGQGLALAKQISDLHGIGLEFRSDGAATLIDGVRYCEFSVRLVFRVPQVA